MRKGKRMGFIFARPLKRASVLLSAAALVAVAPIALTAIPASAAQNCNSFTSGSVTFSVCVYKVNSTTAKAQVGNISGSYISGNLGLYKGSTQVRDSCSGQYHAGSTCNFTDAAGAGNYHSVWHSKGSGDFSSPTISV